MKNKESKMRDRIRELCAEHKWVPYGLSRRAGLGKGAVANILANPSIKPRKATIAKLSVALGITPEYLMGETDVRLEPANLEDSE